VIPVGKDNDYGHPHEEPMSRFRQAGLTLFRTDEMGTVIASSDGHEISFTWSNQSAAPENAEPADTVFIGNKNSKTFHAESCSSLPSEKNRVEFDSYNEAIDAGFTPCRGCLG
jgi:competence protein ComEC